MDAIEVLNSNGSPAIYTYEDFMIYFVKMLAEIGLEVQKQNTTQNKVEKNSFSQIEG
jgi:hypothetical protein